MAKSSTRRSPPNHGIEVPELAPVVQLNAGRIPTVEDWPTLLDAAPAVAFIADLHGNLRYLNALGRRTFGVADDADVSTRTIAELFSDDSRELLLERALPAALQSGEWRGEATLLDARQHTIPVALALVRREAKDKGGTLLALAWDMCAQKEREHDLKHRAMHDPLTGLPNLALLLDRLTHETHAARRNARRFAVLFLDVDRFKSINDDFGHEIANRILVELAVRLYSCVRTTDTIARYGGDEFVVIVPDLERPGVLDCVLARIDAELERPFTAGAKHVHLTVSIGVALFPSDGQDAHALLHHADAAMYTAKARAPRGRAQEPARTSSFATSAS